jgi:uncharacterized protein YdiU (UPF0061 family)
MSTTPNQLELPAHFAGLTFSNRYARLPEQFYARINPTPVRAPGLIKLNHALAEELGLDAAALASAAGVAMLAGNAIPPGAEPIAEAYAGHQFGYFNPQLGDGRAILLGEVIDRNGRPRDIQLKGSGPTPFSRSGDGRAAVGPVIREYIVSEAMHALGIKTTRALAAVTTGQQVYRETALPGAILTRVAASHVRIGTFEYFRHRGDKAGIRRLADFVIDRHYPHAAEADNSYIALLDAVMDAQASLVASWLHVGFIHGVMNTDNMSVSGETIDYGPCAFMDRYDPATVFSSIDRRGRYAFGNQANIALWNLSRLAECLLHLFDDDTEKAVSKAEKQLSGFVEIFEDYWLTGMRRKIGLLTEREGDKSIIETLLQLMQKNQVDYTQNFRYLCDFLSEGLSDGAKPDGEHKLFALYSTDHDALQDWLALWKSRLEKEQLPVELVVNEMRAANPAYIPRNHRIEAVIRAAVERADYTPMMEMIEVLGTPYKDQPGREDYSEPPEPSEEIYQTFCGT